jgi:hypothetical protein
MLVVLLLRVEQESEVFPPPTGPTTSPEQIRELDDAYFAGDVAGYFHNRVDSLVAWAQCQSVDRSSGLAGDVTQRLGFLAQDIAPIDDRLRGVQIAADAFAVRHHAAETLIRLIAAVLMAREKDEVCSIWQTIALGPTPMIEVIKNIQTALDSDESRVLFSRISVPEDILRTEASTPQLERAVRVLGSWVEHAVYLLTRNDINVNAGNNKAKHGMAIRARDDLRVMFSKEGPDASGGIAESVLNGSDAVDILDRPLLQLLSPPPSSVKPKQGLELTWLRLDAAALLAETTMLATALGAIFHVAAKAHRDRYATPESIAPYPPFLLALTADELLGHSVTGMRFPVTDPPDGSVNLRPSGVGFHKDFVSLIVDHAGASKAVVTDN